MTEVKNFHRQTAANLYNALEIESFYACIFKQRVGGTGRRLIVKKLLVGFGKNKYHY